MAKTLSFKRISADIKEDGTVDNAYIFYVVNNNGQVSQKMSSININSVVSLPDLNTAIAAGKALANTAEGINE